MSVCCQAIRVWLGIDLAIDGESCNCRLLSFHFRPEKKKKKQQQQKLFVYRSGVRGLSVRVKTPQFVAVGVSTLFKTFPLYPTDKHKSPCFMIVFFSVLFGFTHILKRKNKNLVEINCLSLNWHQQIIKAVYQIWSNTQRSNNKKEKKNWLSLSPATLKNRLEGWCDGREQTRNVLYVYKEQNEQGEMLSLHLVNKSRTADSVNPVRVLRTFILPCDTLYALR